jgi:hypothetical protein
MTKFTDNLWSDLAREHGPALADRPEPRRARLLRRPRVLAGSTLGLAGAGAALVLALSAASSAPAFAVTTNHDGSVLVSVSQTQDIVQANAKLASMGIHEGLTVFIGRGPAPAKGPVTCTPAPGASSLPGPALRVLLGKDGTEVIAPGTTGDNTGEGTYHLRACFVTSDTGNTGNTGSGS